MDDLLLIIGGPQGSGLETSAIVLTRAFGEKGYNVVADREYHSNIRGRHSYTHMRISVDERYSLAFPVDLFVGMSVESVFTHFMDISENGYFVVDTAFLEQRIDRIVSMEPSVKRRLRKQMQELGVGDRVEDILRFLENRGVNTIKLSYVGYLRMLAKKYDISPRRISRYMSGIAIAVVAALTGIDLESVVDGLRARLSGREELVEHNRYLIERVMDYIQGSYGSPLKLDPPKKLKNEVLVVTGNEAVAIGKILGGLRVQTYYPITPAADESLYLEEKMLLKANSKNLGGIVVFQTEDEIAAITAAIGAALAGARASTTTSGPGFSLMVEGFGWAGINEVPIVVTYYQRGGPSTGMPTRGAQSDLFFALYAGHGEFARIVLSSGDHMEALIDAVDAFNFAERFQVPVIHLLDKFIANSTATVPIPDLSKIRIERGSIVEGGVDYKRFSKDSIVSPRAKLGSNSIMWYTGDEHDEYGHISEDPVNRIEMYEKRIRKMELIDREIPDAKKAVLYGDKNPNIVLIGWGYTKCPAIDAIRKLEDKYSIAYLHIKLLAPLPSSLIRGILREDRILIGVEHSYEVQIASLIRMKSGIHIPHLVAKYTGRPIYENELVDAVERIVENKEKRVVLSYGE